MFFDTVNYKPKSAAHFAMSGAFLLVKVVGLFF